MISDKYRAIAILSSVICLIVGAGFTGAAIERDVPATASVTEGVNR